MRALDDITASPSQLAAQLDEPLANVSYHVIVLADLDVPEFADTRPQACEAGPRRTPQRCDRSRSSQNGMSSSPPPTPALTGFASPAGSEPFA